MNREPILVPKALGISRHGTPAENVKKGPKFADRTQGQDMRDVLVGSDQNETALLAVNTAQVIDVLVGVGRWTVDLFVVEQAIAPFAGEQQGWQALNRQLVVGLLADRDDLDNRIDIRSGGREAAQRRQGFAL